MNESRTLSRHEAKLAVRRQLESELAKQYPRMPRHLRRKYANEAASEALRSAHGAKIVVTRQPSSPWQKLKAQFAPKWFLAKYPVRTIER